MKYKTLSEGCYFQTGRRGVVFEALDNISPNLFTDNKNINNSILSKYSKFKFTIVDTRDRKEGTKIVDYNLDINEALLLNYLFSDGVPNILKKRIGAYNNLSATEQLEIKNLVETFPNIDHNRFDRLLDYSSDSEATSVTLQKNILDFNSSIRNKLIVKKITLSYEEKMSSSKFKIAIENGEAMKDVSRGNGLNIIKHGTYKTLKQTHLMLTRGEFTSSISGAAQRVVLANQSFYREMKMAEKDFTDKKFKNRDFRGERIDEWNPKGKSKFKPVKQKEVKTQKEETNIQNEEKVRKCSICNVNIDENVYNFSTKVHKKPLCLPCQNKNNSGKECSDCGKSIDNNVYNYSKKNHGKPLCLSCQNK